MPWPDEYDDWTAPAPTATRNNLTTVIETIYTAIETIQHTLGLLPQGTSDTLTERLDALTTSLTEGLDSADTALGQAMSDHVDDADPHSGKYGKIITPDQPDGGGELDIGGSPSATGADYVAWVDTEE